MKIKIFFALIVVGVFSIFVSSCSKSDVLPDLENIPLTLLDVSTKSGSEGVSTINLTNVIPALDTTAPLTADEIEFLYAMREDERLARDLYAVYALRFTDEVLFYNLSLAESNHIAAVERLFTYYEIDYPELGDKGVFSDESLQKRYNELVEADSIADALKITANIEEKNVTAYKFVLTTADNSNIRLLLENMIRASSNHLRAAVRQIMKLGDTYTPEYMDQESFDDLVANGFEYGKMYQHKYGNGNSDSHTNAGKRGDQQGRKGSVNNNGECTGTVNGSSNGSGSGEGNVGRGYRGGR